MVLEYDVVSGRPGREVWTLCFTWEYTENLAGNLEIWQQNLAGQKNLEQLAGQPIQICNKMTKSRPWKNLASLNLELWNDFPIRKDLKCVVRRRLYLLSSHVSGLAHRLSTFYCRYICLTIYYVKIQYKYFLLNYYEFISTFYYVHLFLLYIIT